MNTETCFTCKFYFATTRGRNFCHRYPPRDGRFAEVNPQDWCGEFLVKFIEIEVPVPPVAVVETLKPKGKKK